MRAKEFLSEYDRSREQSRIEAVPAYSARIKQDPGFSLERLESADPTPQKIYVPRLATWWLRGAKLEDLLSRGADSLEKFAQLKQKNLLKPEHKDINGFKQFGDFEDAMQPYQLPSQPEQTKQDRGKYQEIYRDSELLVVELLDQKAAEFWGQGTKWCTAAKKNNMFARYAEQGPLYVIIPRTDPDHRYQLWWDKTDPADVQFMDEQDQAVSPVKLSFFDKLQTIMRPLHSHIMWKSNPTEAEQLAAVHQCTMVIQYIPNPSEAVQLAAVNQDSYAIQYILNPSEKVQLAAVKRNGLSIRYILNPREKVQMMAVQQSVLAIKFINNPTEAVQLATVQQDGYAIQWITNPSEAVQMAAVRQNLGAIEDIPNPSEKVQLAAVQQKGLNIVHITNPTEAVQLAAVRKDPRLFQFISQPTPAVRALYQKLTGAK